MKMKQIYICETCGKESEVQFEIEICEANHLGITVEEMHCYNDLQSTLTYFKKMYKETGLYMYYKILCDYTDKLDTFKIEHHLTKPITKTEVTDEKHSDN